MLELKASARVEAGLSEPCASIQELLYRIAERIFTSQLLRQPQPFRASTQPHAQATVPDVTPRPPSH